MIRYLEQEEKEKIIPLYNMCFDDTEEYCDYYFGKRLPRNEVAVLEESGLIKGMIHLIAKNVVCGNTLESVAYLYAVATHPEFRKQGVMGRILDKVLCDLRQRGDGFTYLIPSSEENAQIYQKYGFARVMDKCEYCLSTEKIQMNLLGASLEFKKAGKEDLTKLSDFAQKIMAERYDIYIGKTRQYFEEMLELMQADGGAILLYVLDSEIRGYQIGSADEVLEEVWDDWFMSLVKASCDMSCKKNITPYAMARILNIPRILNDIETQEKGHVYIEVVDSIIEENNGVFLWEFSPLGNCWEKSSHEADIKVTIGEFTEYLFGYHAVNEYENEILQQVTSLDRGNILKNRLPQINTKQGFYINDYV